MGETVKQRLMDYLNYRGIPVTKFSQDIGGSRTYVNSISKSIQPDKLSRISEQYPELNIGWLLTGTGDMLNTDIAPDISSTKLYFIEQAEKATKREKKVFEMNQETRPRITTEVAAGALMDFADAVMEYQCEKMPVIKQFPNYDYTIIVKGNSMSPKYEGGDELAIKKVNSFIEWGEVYVLNTRDGAVLKRIYDAGDCFKCVSYNKEYEDYLVNKEDVFSVYRVVGMIRI